jgi:hypothetical protein
VRKLAFAGLVLGLAACRGGERPSSDDLALQQTIDSLVPLVEQATGLPFKRHPRGRMIDRAEASAYIAAQLDRQLGDRRGEHLTAAYKLLGLLPDSIDLRTLYQAVLTEQVAGFYDPERDLFFGVRGNPAAMRLLVSHELVHALQHDYVPLDSLMNARDDSDRLLAAHSVLEGQAMLASTRMNPDAGDRVFEAEFWELAQAQADAQMGTMPVLAAAPRVIREALTFPYIGGGAYIAWWMRSHPAGEMPFGSRLPTSSEEILAAGRLVAGDHPWTVTIQGGTDPAFNDVVGAVGLRVLLAEARGRDLLPDVATLGWGGDRFALYTTPEGEALVWVALFDTPLARDRALGALAEWPRARGGYRRDLAPLEVSGRPGLRLTVAPTRWARWNSIPNAIALRDTL